MFQNSNQDSEDVPENETENSSILEKLKENFASAKERQIKIKY